MDRVKSPCACGWFNLCHDSTNLVLTRGLCQPEDPCANNFSQFVYKDYYHQIWLSGGFYAVL